MKAVGRWTVIATDKKTGRELWRETRENTMTQLGMVNVMGILRDPSDSTEAGIAKRWHPKNTGLNIRIKNGNLTPFTSSGGPLTSGTQYEAPTAGKPVRLRWTDNGNTAYNFQDLELIKPGLLNNVIVLTSVRFPDNVSRRKETSVNLTFEYQMMILAVEGMADGSGLALTKFVGGFMSGSWTVKITSGTAPDQEDGTLGTLVAETETNNRAKLTIPISSANTGTGKQINGFFLKLGSSNIVHYAKASGEYIPPRNGGKLNWTVTLTMAKAANLRMFFYAPEDTTKPLKDPPTWWITAGEDAYVSMDGFGGTGEPYRFVLLDTGDDYGLYQKPAWANMDADGQRIYLNPSATVHNTDLEAKTFNLQVRVYDSGDAYSDVGGALTVRVKTSFVGGTHGVGTTEDPPDGGVFDDDDE